MKIGFDVSQTGSGKAGCGYFAYSLVKQLSMIDQQNDYILYPTFGNYYWDHNHHNVVNIEQNNFKKGLAHPNIHEAKKFWKNFQSQQEHELGKIDILQANNFFCPPKLSNAKIIYTLYDLSFLEHPEYTTEENRMACFNGVFNASINADHIISISHYSRQHFLETFPHFPAERISVCHLASRFDPNYEFTEPSRLMDLKPGKFWLNVGTLEPRKNQKQLLRAYAALSASKIETMPLVFAGGTGWMLEDFEKLIVELNLQKKVILLGYVNDHELYWLYKNCFCLVYPSFFEGFGLPVLEAMSLGAATITSNNSSLPEVVGDAGILIDPSKIDDLMSAMYKVASDPKLLANLKNKAVHQAQKFSWYETAKRVLEIYNQVV